MGRVHLGDLFICHLCLKETPPVLVYLTLERGVEAETLEFSGEKREKPILDLIHFHLKICKSQSKLISLH